MKTLICVSVQFFTSSTNYVAQCLMIAAPQLPLSTMADVAPFKYQMFESSKFRSTYIGTSRNLKL